MKITLSYRATILLVYLGKKTTTNYIKRKQLHITNVKLKRDNGSDKKRKMDAWNVQLLKSKLKSRTWINSDTWTMVKADSLQMDIAIFMRGNLRSIWNA